MPIERVVKDGKPGYRWGKNGKTYTYTPGDEEGRKRAKSKAEKQGRAIEATKNEIETVVNETISGIIGDGDVRT